MTAEPHWTYWCPPEGTHWVHPQELMVGAASMDDTGHLTPVIVAAVVPPIQHYGGGWHQMEGFAIAIRDALEAASEEWAKPDGLNDWLYCHSVEKIRLPSPMPVLTPPAENQEG